VTYAPTLSRWQADAARENRRARLAELTDADGNVEPGDVLAMMGFPAPGLTRVGERFVHQTMENA
jgi:hypothetical protein